jgi:hypothetical protein
MAAARAELSPGGGRRWAVLAAQPLVFGLGTQAAAGRWLWAGFFAAGLFLVHREQCDLPFKFSISEAFLSCFFSCFLAVLIKVNISV